MVTRHVDSVLARKLNTFLPLSADELDCLASIQSPPVTVRRGKHLVREGQTGHKAFVLHAGWACSYKDLANGSRQIISFPLAGDCVGLRSVLLRTADHSFSALTNSVVSVVEGAHIMKCVTEFPRLGAALLWAASRDEAMVVEHLVNIGRRSAIERTAHFFMELAERLHIIGLGTAERVRVPAQPDRTRRCAGPQRHSRQPRVAATARAGFAHAAEGHRSIHDLSGLRKLAGFQGGYLDARD